MTIAAAHKASVFDGANASTYVTGSWTPTANRLVLACVENARTGTPTTPTLSGNGLTWTQVATYVNDTVDPQFRLTVFVAKTGGSPSAGAVTASFGGVSQIGGSIIVDELDAAYLSGTDLDAIVQNKTGSVDTTGTSESITLDSGITSGNASYGAIFTQHANAITPGNSHTTLGDGNHTGPVAHLVTIFKAAGSQTVDASWSSAGGGTVGKGGIALEIKAAGGTTYTQSVSGGITPTGDLTKLTGKIVAGALATITGALVKQAQKTLSGAVSSIVGTITKSAQKNVAGNLTSSGTVSKQTNKALSGAVSTIAGTLESIRLFVVSLSGSITPSGTITKQTNKALSGGNAPAGILTRLTAKLFSGSLTPAGTTTKQTNKSFAGDLTSSGTQTRATLKSLSGEMTSGGTLQRFISKSLAGAVSLVGALVTVANLVTPVVAQVRDSIGRVTRMWIKERKRRIKHGP
jgi:hypothetical protein